MLLAAGLFFQAVAALGVLRMPDFYTRLHAVSKTETAGVVLMVAGLIVMTGVSLVSVKLAFLALFLFLANPTSTHAIARAALRAGQKPWRREPGDAP
ncbi:MAG: monovalent cation/H(+) antiporter subunit G [Candidatus Rokubacteria bacterium]|nr:monovalent cation/H(+) antiporter subunit G [Candidatus Rokubacteria bacterium]